jgi:hypothetical protein
MRMRMKNATFWIATIVKVSWLRVMFELVYALFWSMD